MRAGLEWFRKCPRVGAWCAHAYLMLKVRGASLGAPLGCVCLPVRLGVSLQLRLERPAVLLRLQAARLHLLEAAGLAPGLSVSLLQLVKPRPKVVRAAGCTYALGWRGKGVGGRGTVGEADKGTIEV